MSHKGLRLWKFYDEYCFSRLACGNKMGDINHLSFADMGKISTHICFYPIFYHCGKRTIRLYVFCP